jgi:rod shape-determining protein MreD
VRPILAFFASALLLWAVVAQVNHELAPLHFSLFLGGLFVTEAALILPLSGGFAVAFFSGALLDAHAPVAFGTHALLFTLCDALIYHLRERLPRDDTGGRVAIALLVNLGQFLALSFLQIGHSPAPPGIWPRLFSDLIASQLVLAVVAPWFLALQGRALQLAGAEPQASR